MPQTIVVMVADEIRDSPISTWSDDFIVGTDIGLPDDPGLRIGYIHLGSRGRRCKNPHRVVWSGQFSNRNDARPDRRRYSQFLTVREGVGSELIKYEQGNLLVLVARTDATEFIDSLQSTGVEVQVREHHGTLCLGKTDSRHRRRFH